jgi:hypothetical protein
VDVDSDKARVSRCDYRLDQRICDCLIVGFLLCTAIVGQVPKDPLASPELLPKTLRPEKSPPPELLKVPKPRFCLHEFSIFLPSRRCTF